MTPIEIITSSIAGAALIVAWLARLDSKKSAAAAQKSAEAAQRVTELMARQIELASSEQKRLLQNDIAESRPLFSWRCSGGITDGQYFGFINHGAVMSNPKVIVDSGLEGWVEPRDVIASGQEGKLNINFSKVQKLPQAVKLSIEFTDKRDNRGKMDFNFLSHAVGKYFNFPPQPV